MRAPISWIGDYADLPAGLDPRALGDALVRVGLEVEKVESAAESLSGPIVVGRVLSFDAEAQKNGKTIRWCQVDVGGGEGDSTQPRGIVCGASNFLAGDLIVAALPGAVLPGGFAISARKTYGHVSDGMICSVRELGIGDEHDGILVLAPDVAKPGDDAREVLGLDDAVLDLAVTPDRGYCLSVRGLAREAAVALGTTFTDISVSLPPVDGQAYPVSVSDPSGCDQFSVRTVTELDPGAATPPLILERLRACGMRAVSLAVDVTNYVMLETGQPLHAFDRDKLRGSLGVRRAGPGERLRTLDDVDRRLDPDDLVVTDDSGPIALAGVMGGASTEIDGQTRAVVLEAAHWNPASISRAVRRHKLPSEAAKRFERGVDPAIAAVALQRCVDLLAEHGGARPVDGFTVVGEGPAPQPITLSSQRPTQLSGLAIDDDTVRRRLIEVGCQVDVAAGETTSGLALSVLPPSWRPDLTDPADLVEEVVRLEGYDRIPSTLPTPPPGRGLSDQQRLRRSVSRALAGAGFTEVISYPFVASEVRELLGGGADAIRLANPISDAEPEMRMSLLPGLLANLIRNVGRGARDLAIFETGLVYLPAESDEPPPRPGVSRRPSDEELAAIARSLPRQPRHAAVALAGNVELAGWWGPARAAQWSDAVQAARSIAAVYFTELEVRAADIVPWHPGRCAELILAGQSIGAAGELHPRVVTALGLPPRTCAMELNLDAFQVPEPPRAPVLSAFPPVLLDLALVVGADVPAESVRLAVREGAGALLESVRLFDVYADADRLGVGLKSLAFSLRFRAQDRTLTVDEAVAARDAAVRLAYERCGAVLRA